MKQKIIRFLDHMQIFPKTLGLGRMRRLMDRLGNPQEDVKVIHVAGTNGKGSVCSMLTSVLMKSGYTVGLFTSPHLIDYNERIQIQRIPIDDNRFGEIGLIVKEVCEEMVEAGEEMPSLFEYLTAMAFFHFAKEGVDFVVLETGIGGTYDATNIVSCPMVSVITSIGKDHMSILGTSIEEITREKAGIIKENCPTVLYNSDNTVYNIVNNVCENKHSLLFTGREALINNQKFSIDDTIFSVTTPYFTYIDIGLQLIGEYQISNAITALVTVEVLRKLGCQISDHSIYQGLWDAEWAGRMEILQKEPTIIIDGAHNEESTEAFIQTLSKIAKGSKVYMLIGVLQDKDYRTILKVLLPYAHTIIVTQSSHPRALPAQDLYQEINLMQNQMIKSNYALEYPRVNLILEENLPYAYKKGKELLLEKDVLCCVGSLYLVGELKEILQK